MHDIAEHSPDPTLVVNAAGMVTWVNAAGRELWGHRLASLNRTLGDALAAEVSRLGAELAGVGDRREIEVVSPRHGPGRVVVQTRTVGGLVVYLQAGRPNGPAPEPVEGDQAHLNALGRLSGGVAHDFNNLLLAVLGHADLIESDAEATRDIAQSAGEIRRAGEQAAALTRELLAFGRRQRLRLENVDLGAVVRRAATVLEGQNQRGVEITVEAPQDPLFAAIDPARIERVLVDLGSAAMRGMGAGGRVMISAFRPSLHDDVPRQISACVEVRDTGQAISKTDLAQIFEPFYTTREMGRGTGLGLAGVHGTVHQHGGRISVQSVPGRGTVFRICLPLAERAPPVTAAPAAHIANQRRGRIMLVESDPLVQTLVKRVLTSAGFRVDEFGDTTDAINAFDKRREAYSLILIDMKTPTEGGLSVCHRILHSSPDQRVVITASGSDSLVDLPPGVMMLTKPYLPDDLLAVLAQGVTTAG